MPETVQQERPTQRKPAGTVAVARAYFEAISARDIDAACALWKPGGVDRFVGQFELVAPDDVRRYFAELFDAFPDWHFEILDTSAQAERCAVRWRATATFAGPGSFQGLAPTGAHIDIEGCDVVRVREGKIEHNDAYFDSGAVARQIGVLPPAGSATEQRMTAAVNVRTRLLGKLVAAPPERVAEGVWLIRGGLARTMNVYLLEEPDGGVTVFDAGEKGMAGAIAGAGARMGGIKRVVLGHADTDHRGSAPALAATGIPVHCHADAVAEAQGSGGRSYWHLERLPWAVRKLHGFLHEHVWDGGPVRIADTVDEGDEIAGFRVMLLDGHAPGLIGLWRESDRLAIVTDCFYLTDMWGRHVPPVVPNDAYNLDTERARASIRKLAALDPAKACPGHLGPLEGDDVREQLERAAAA